MASSAPEAVVSRLLYLLEFLAQQDCEASPHNALEQTLHCSLIAVSNGRQHLSLQLLLRFVVPLGCVIIYQKILLVGTIVHTDARKITADALDIAGAA